MQTLVISRTNEYSVLSLINDESGRDFWEKYFGRQVLLMVVICAFVADS